MVESPVVDTPARFFSLDVSFTGLRGTISRRTANDMIIPKMVRECFARGEDFARCVFRKLSTRPTVTSRTVKFPNVGITSVRSSRS